MKSRKGTYKTDKVVGVDGYNQTITGDVAMTVTCAASDCHHVPLVIEMREKDKANGTDE